MSFDGRYSQDDFVLKYICLWAYGYINGFGYSEGVYSSITNLSIGEPDVSKILDVGCGVGRTAFDLSKLYPNAMIKGIDASEKMIYYANMLNSREEKECDNIEFADFENIKFKIPLFKRKNIVFEKLSYDTSQSNTEQYDIITNVNYLDRCNNIIQSVINFYLNLKKRGIVVGATPLNFRGRTAYTANELRRIFLDVGFIEEVFFDNLPYFEVMDSRRSGEFYNIACFKYRKPKC